MTPALLQRLLGLAAVALLAGLVAVAVVREEDEASNAAVPTPAPAFEGEDGWYVARAGSRGVARDAERTTCGTLLTDRSLGVAHPVLPCGAKIFLLHDGEELLTEVIDNRLSSAQRQFELTPRLAAQLGVEGTQQLRWRFAVRDQGATR
jgi:hypothetical protein